MLESESETRSDKIQHPGRWMKAISNHDQVPERGRTWSHRQMQPYCLMDGDHTVHIIMT